jgi:hypothetical protein
MKLVKDPNMESIIRATFNADTKREFLASDRLYFGHRYNMKNLTSGTIVLCHDSTENEIFGVAVLGKFPSSEVCRLHHQLDTDVYSPEHARYNKYDICIDRIRIFKTPISCERLSVMLSIDNKFANNITKGNTTNFAKLFHKSDNEAQVLERVRYWLSTLEL